MLCIISLVIFTDFIPSPVDRYEYGYYLLYFVATACAINIMLLIITIVVAIYLAIRKFLRKRKYKEHMKIVEEKRAAMKVKKE